MIAIHNAVSIEEVFREWCYNLNMDSEADITCIRFIGKKLENEITLFKTIAPFVKPGSYIQMIDIVGGELWRWFFDGETCIVQVPDITWVNKE